MAVDVMHKQWLESHRQRCWLRLREVVRRVDEKDLKRLLRALPEFVTTI